MEKGREWAPGCSNLEHLGRGEEGSEERGVAMRNNNRLCCHMKSPGKSPK